MFIISFKNNDRKKIHLLKYCTSSTAPFVILTSALLYFYSTTFRSKYGTFNSTAAANLQNNILYIIITIKLNYFIHCHTLNYYY